MYQSIKGQERSVGRLLLFILKMSAASGIAWELAKLAGSKHPYLAPLSVILCVQTTILQSVQYSVHRLLGTIVGVLLTAWVVDVLFFKAGRLASERLPRGLASGASQRGTGFSTRVVSSGTEDGESDGKYEMEHLCQKKPFFTAKKPRSTLFNKTRGRLSANGREPISRMAHQRHLVCR
jgi:hypothetical protein